MKVLLISLYFTILLITVTECEIPGEVIVETINGRIRGNVIQFNNHTVNHFIGIRYAEPPVGELRFAKPKPVKSWNDIYDATKERYSCYQKHTTPIIDQILPKLNMSEDCLFLNVWSPSRDLGTNHNASLLPVMFWIHGGSFLTGSSFFPIYSGIALSTYDVVVVSINYRLAEFGFLYGGSDEAPGSAGFWDQILALKWVKDNIRSFGGNPNDVTIFGESAGSMSVTRLIISPAAKGLFRKAIAQSGASYWLPSKETPSAVLKRSLDNSKKLSKSLGCPENDQWLQCMKEMDPQKIINNENVELKYVFLPIWGDEFMPNTPKDAIQSGDYNHGIELMAGVNQNEGISFINTLVPEAANNKTILKSQIKSIFKEKLNLQIPDIDLNKIYEHYFDSIDQRDHMAIRRTLGEVYGDYLINCPAYYYAKDYASQSSDNRVHFYRFTHRSESIINPFCNESWMGVCHGEDLIFTFGTLLFTQNSRTDISFTKQMMQLWTNFAKSGNPLKPVQFNYPLLWPSFRDNSFGTVIPKSFEINPYKFGDIRTEEFKENCDKFWKPHFVDSN